MSTASLPLALFLAYGAAAQVAPAPDPTAILQTLEELHETYRDLRDGMPYTTDGLEPVDPDLVLLIGLAGLIVVNRRPVGGAAVDQGLGGEFWAIVPSEKEVKSGQVLL